MISFCIKEIFILIFIPYNYKMAIGSDRKLAIENEKWCVDNQSSIILRYGTENPTDFKIKKKKSVTFSDGVEVFDLPDVKFASPLKVKEDGDRIHFLLLLNYCENISDDRISILASKILLLISECIRQNYCRIYFNVDSGNNDIKRIEEAIAVVENCCQLTTATGSFLNFLSNSGKIKLNLF
jgi:hypothetical protein